MEASRGHLHRCGECLLLRDPGVVSLNPGQLGVRQAPRSALPCLRLLRRFSTAVYSFIHLLMRRMGGRLSLTGPLPKCLQWLRLGQELGTQSRSPMCVAGTPLPEASPQLPRACTGRNLELQIRSRYSVLRYLGQM